MGPLDSDQYGLLQGTEQSKSVSTTSFRGLKDTTLDRQDGSYEARVQFESKLLLVFTVRGNSFLDARAIEARRGQKIADRYIVEGPKIVI